MNGINVPDWQVLAMLAGETERLWGKIGVQYNDEDDAPDRLAEFIIACRTAADAEPQPDQGAQKYSSLSPKAIKQRKNRLRNERKRAKKARRANR